MKKINNKLAINIDLPCTTGLPIVRGKYKFNYNLSAMTWFKVGGNADIFFKPEDEEDLVAFLTQNNIYPITVLGAGSNVIIRDQGIEGVVIKLSRGFTGIEWLPDGRLMVGAGCLNFNLAKFALASSLTGFEFLVGIPGTIGGGIAMNAGSYGYEFKDIVSHVFAIDYSGNKFEIPLQDIGFAYRKNNLPANLIFTKVAFNIQKGEIDKIRNKMEQISMARSGTQPIKERTGGSSFANPPGFKAWELIDSVGLRGFKIGGAMFSPKHCNFIVNDGSATATDIEMLGNLARQKVKEIHNLDLAWEIKRLGRKS